MTHSATQDYLATEVMTAAPQKLQLMLIEAAIRSAERARKNWRDGNNEAAMEALCHAQKVVSELLSGLNREVDPKLVGKVASVYLFIFRSLTEAGHQHDEKKLDDALRVLNVERETWRLLCDKLGGNGGSPNPPAPIAPPAESAEASAADSGLSLEA